MTDTNIKAEIVEVGRRLYARGLIGGNEGNISVREGGSLFVTPAGMCKGFLTEEMIVKADLEGRKIEGRERVSTEVAMHVAVYSRRADVRAVVHAHPPTATGFAVAGIPLDRPLIAEAVVVLGKVPVIPYGQPSTAELARNVGNVICDAQGLLLANHGALTVGESLPRAWERMETLEQLAKITLVTHLLGRDNLLRPGEVERLLGAQGASGYPPPVCLSDLPKPASGAVDGKDAVVLSRSDLVRLLSEAVERFGSGRT